MKQLLKQIIKKSPLYNPLCNWMKKRRQTKELAEWEIKGKPIPLPHLLKQKVLQEYSIQYCLKILVETGTYYGEMIDAMKGDFDRIYSIELSKNLYENAVLRFNKINNINIIHGDSASQLGNILQKLRQPALFWLDAHYSAGVTARGDKDTPIYEELNLILNARDMGHVILIDDARCFGTDTAYPSIEELVGFIRSKKSNVDIAVLDDIIRITPKQ